MARPIHTMFCLIVAASALRVPFERRASRSGAALGQPRSGSRYSFGSSMDKETVGNVEDFRYTVNITLNGQSIHVALDTGSSDLWVNPPGGLSQVNESQIPLRLMYGDGSYGVSGKIATANFAFGSYSVARQAFLNVDFSSVDGMDELGVHGVLGLSFDFAQASPISDKVKAIEGDGATWASPVLQNVFQQSPSTPNFIAIDLSRTDDLEDTNGGSFFIGEYDPYHSVVANTEKIPQYPAGGSRWTALLKGVAVDGTSVPLPQSNVPSTVDGLVSLIDTGDPKAILPTALWDGIYSRIPGSVKYTDASSASIWIVPCNTTSIVEVSFGERAFAFHPVDLTSISEPLSIDGNVVVACVSALRGVDNWGGTEFDVSLGTSFLRNVYSVFDFGGGEASGPYLQFLSQVSPMEAAAQVQTIRARTMADLPPELPPTEFVRRITSGTDAVPAATDAPPVEPTGAHSEGHSSSKANTHQVDASTNSFSLDNPEVRRYGLIALCLLGANVIIGLVLVVFSILSFASRRDVRRVPKLAAAPSEAQYVPVRLQDDTSYSGFQKPHSQ